ncbi:hypothetical protein FIBSPDRAFT_894002 [Athelia psychrophila]|uniref:Uncharacterized protein n=1 Tax=Athelia psychrophila TaxID=1759441 RepID=A0A166GEP6_9AGAM|nr:hypothetical protein FIBSPDRAFT_894002 [Fibularhizoctonia sp. CBS 109695]
MFQWTVASEQAANECPQPFATHCAAQYSLREHQFDSVQLYFFTTTSCDAKHKKNGEKRQLSFSTDLRMIATTRASEMLKWKGCQLEQAPEKKHTGTAVAKMTADRAVNTGQINLNTLQDAQCDPACEVVAEPTLQYHRSPVTEDKILAWDLESRTLVNVTLPYIDTNSCTLKWDNHTNETDKSINMALRRLAEPTPEVGETASEHSSHQATHSRIQDISDDIEDAKREHCERCAKLTRATESLVKEEEEEVA